VKVSDESTNLDQLSQKVLEIKMDGLVWGESKKVDIAYGLQKLQINCVIEDEKITSTDDIFEQIEAWEEVQSVDLLSMQKL
jgi:translation elongation factor EF-1beta